MTGKNPLPADPVNVADLVGYQPDAVVSRTLLKKATGTVTVFAFAQGQSLSEHTVPHDALVQVLDGQAEITVSGKLSRVSAGELLLMLGGEPHAVHAAQSFKMLLTMIKA